MNKILPSLSIALLVSAIASNSALAQTIAVFPNEYSAVPEGPLNSPNLPLARGTSRVQCLYDRLDLDIPSGDQITKLGFREDGTLPQMEMGVSMQLEVRMGWSTFDNQSMTSNFDNNYDSPPVTVFGPAIYNLPNLRDPASPLPNGQFFIDLATPFDYTPNGRNLVVEYRVFGTSTGGGQFLYRLDRADYYSVVSYGPDGCQHSAGNTATQTINPTRPGLSWSGQVASGPFNAPAFMAVNVGSPSAAPYPINNVFAGIDVTCTGQMALTGTVLLGGLTSSGGSASWSFQIPNDNAFGDIPISSQAIFLDFFSPGQVVVSNGAQVQTGVRTRSAIISAVGPPTTVTTGAKANYYAPVAFFEHQ